MKQVGVALGKAWRHSDALHPTKAKHLVVIMNGAPKENSRNESKGKPRPGREDPEDDVILLDSLVFSFWCRSSWTSIIYPLQMY